MMVVLSQMIPAYYFEVKDEVDGYSPMWQFFLSKGFISTILVISSILTGLGQSFLWVAQGEYMSLSANDKTLGLYFGINWAFYMFTQILGNFIGSEMVS